MLEQGETAKIEQNKGIAMPMISRRIFPPRGWIWFESRTEWPKDSGFFSGKTFEEVVDAIIQHREANPRHASQWTLDWDEVAKQLDEFTCLRLGYDPNYCTGPVIPAGGATKKVLSSLPSRIQQGARAVVAAGVKVAAGVGVMIDWLGDGLKPVAQELANKRAEVCSTCPQNQPGDLTSFFTIPASNLIRAQIEMKNEMKLATAFDVKLGVCRVCACPLKTKVWSHLKHVLKHQTPEIMAQLPSYCWMVLEAKEQK